MVQVSMEVFLSMFIDEAAALPGAPQVILLWSRHISMWVNERNLVYAIAGVKRKPMKHPPKGVHNRAFQGACMGLPLEK